jgi:alpha-beta hydrolase superfamily lysophospholipase
MKYSTFTFADVDGIEIFVYKWLPDNKTPKAVVQISHGMQEHAGRYVRLAKYLTDAGYGVYANDQRGHGKTALGADKLGYLEPGGWSHTVLVIKGVTDIVKREYPKIPVFLLGHSWGSFLVQNYIEHWGSEIGGAILSGTHGKDPMVKLGILLGKLIKKTKGPDATGGLLEKIAVGGLNKKFEPARTKKDWLSRDKVEVDQYIADPYCGKSFPNSFFLNLVELLNATWDTRNERNIPIELPIYLFSGSMDPVSKFTKTVDALVERYKKYGIKDVTYKYYKEARHETLNETNRSEVMNDLLIWLDAHP